MTLTTNNQMEEGLKIMVVDDNKESLRVTGNYLKTKGYKLALARNGDEAFKILESIEIDLILLDIMMPGMDGFEVCTRLKQDQQRKEIPVIFLSAKSETDDIVTGFKVGGDDYITKPYRKEELFVRVSKHLDIKLMKEQLKKLTDQLANS
jgi:two-component system, sensor histidine kinase and response regulator